MDGTPKTVGIKGLKEKGASGMERSMGNTVGGQDSGSVRRGYLS